MECKKAVKMIKRFMDDDLSIDEMRDFIEHIENCEECKEELTIEFLVSEGLKRLEGGNVFDLNKELNARLSTSRRDLKMREGMQWFYFVIIGLIVVAIATIILLCIFL